MQLLKTSWNSSFKPGFYFLLGLVLTTLSFLLYQASDIYQKIILWGLLLYFFSLILKKYQPACLILSLVIASFLFLVKVDQKSNTFTLNSATTLQIYPDEVTIKDDYLTGIAHATSGSILVGIKPDATLKQAIKAGKNVLLTNLTGEVSEIETPTNFGQFDYRKYYASKKIFQRVKLKTATSVPTSISLWTWLHYLRFKLQEYFNTSPRLLGFFASELVLGENNNAENQEVLDNYRNLGVIHLLSISGLHVAIYSLVISVICYWLKFTEEETFGICSLILLLGIFICAGQAGFVRSCLTYFLVGLLKLINRKLTAADLLGLTVIIHLLFWPRLFLSMGAILSYVLVLGLKFVQGFGEFKQAALLNFLLTPLLLFSFYQVNLLTVFFNFLVVPYFNFVVMPLVFINIFLFNAFPVISNFFEQILELSESLIGYLASKNWGTITFGKINWWQTVLLLGLAILFLTYLPYQNKTWFKFLLPGQFLLYLIIFMGIHFPLAGQVTFIDVGQGDSILITTPIFRKSYLIDTGGKLNFSKHKSRPQIEQITLPFLRAQGIDHLDGVFLSHQDADHIGDLGPLLENIQVDNLYFAKGLLANPSFRKRINHRINHTRLVELLAGDVVNGAIKFNVVYPDHPGLGKNEDSLSLTFSIQNKRWLFTGDLDRAGEEKIYQKTPFKVDYFKLGHHGSKTSSSPKFLQAIQPKMVFISAGRNNRFGHPNPETLRTLSQQNLPYLSTQSYGSISYKFGFTKERFETFLGGK